MTTIRPAAPGDAAAATAVARAAFEVYVPRIGVEPWPMKADYAALIADGDVWVAESESENEHRVVGVLVLEGGADHLLLDIVAVAPEHQGSGLGTRLIRFVEATARSRGLHEVRLFTNEAMTENIAYYTRLGFTETGRESQEGYARVFFVKAL